MDVNVMCYRVDDRVWTEGIYPLKLHEYLAAGRPVVSADLPSVRPFGRVVQIASGVAEWQAALASALEGGGAGSIEERQALARANTWDRRVCELERWLIEMVHSNSAS
jgi:hypothetical protein